MNGITKEKLDDIRKQARDKGLNPILECKKVVGIHNLTGLAMCEDLNERYLIDNPVKSLTMELEKCNKEGYCDSLYILEKMRLMNCHMSDLYRMTSLGEKYHKACEVYRSK